MTQGINAAVEIARILIEFQIEEMKKADALTRQDEIASAIDTTANGSGQDIVPQPETSGESPGLVNNNHHYHKSFWTKNGGV